MIKPTTLWGLIVMGVTVFSVNVVIYALQPTVILSENGEEREIKTVASTVEELLKEEGIDVAQHDYLSVSIVTPITQDMTIVYRKAKRVNMIRDGKAIELWTTAPSIQAFLDEQHIRYREQDYLSIPLETTVENDLTFVLKTGKQVVFKDGTNQAQSIWTLQDTLEAFMREQRIQLSELDRIESESKHLTDGQVISIIRVEKKEVTETKDVAYAVVTKRDETVPTGQKQVVTKGQKGQQLVRYEVLYENDQEVERTMVEEKVIQTPIHEVIAVGAKPAMATVSRGSEPTQSTKEFYVTATAYTAYCKGCSGKTATGLDLRANPTLKVIAVDPKIIPLGTKVWVEGYGYAIAADTGGAIKGYKIDVFIPDNGQTRQWGRKKVRIRILTE